MKAMYAVHRKEASANAADLHAWQPVVFSTPSKNGAAMSASATTTDFSVSSHIPAEGAITFDAVFIKEIDAKPRTGGGTSHSVILVPFGIGQLVANYPNDVPHVTLPATAVGEQPKRVPLIEPLTKDGSAIRIKYKIYKRPGDAGKSRVKDFIDIAQNKSARDMNRESIVANGDSIKVGILVNPLNKGYVPFIAPTPGTCVRVVDFSIGTNADGRACYLNVASIDERPHADLNRLSEADRLAAVFPAEQQALPVLDTMLPVRQVMEQISQNGTERYAANKARNLAADDAGAPIITYMRAEQTQTWNMGDAPSEPYKAEPLLPMHSFPPNPVTKGIFLYPLDNTRSLVTGDQLKKFRLEMNFIALNAGKCMRLDNAMIWPSNFASLGITYPSFIEALLRQHPISFQLLFGVDLAQTLMNDANLPANRPKAFPDGTIAADVQMLAFRTEDYVERQGIPVSLGFTRSRFFLKDGNDTLAPRYHEDKPAATSVGIKDFAMLPAQLKLDKPLYSSNEAFEKMGFVALDCGTFTIPTEPTDDIRFFVLPTMPLNGEVRRAPRADPFVDDAPEDLPFAVDMTAAEGDALVTKNCPNERLPSDLRGWTVDTNNGKGPVPRFFFFMQRKRSAAETAERVAVFKKTRDAMNRSYPVLEALDLPADLEEWRRRIMAPSPDTSDAVVEAPNAVKNENKRFLEDPDNSLQPDSKYARIETDADADAVA